MIDYPYHVLEAMAGQAKENMGRDNLGIPHSYIRHKIRT